MTTISHKTNLIGTKPKPKKDGGGWDVEVFE